MGRRDQDDPNPKDDGRRDVGRDGDTGKRTGDNIDPKKWEKEKHWDDWHRDEAQSAKTGRPCCGQGLTPTAASPYRAG